MKRNKWNNLPLQSLCDRFVKIITLGYFQKTHFFWCCFQLQERSSGRNTSLLGSSPMIHVRSRQAYASEVGPPSQRSLVMHLSPSLYKHRSNHHQTSSAVWKNMGRFLFLVQFFSLLNSFIWNKVSFLLWINYQKADWFKYHVNQGSQALCVLSECVTKQDWRNFFCISKLSYQLCVSTSKCPIIKTTFSSFCIDASLSAST